MSYDAGSSSDDGTCAKMAGDGSYTYGYAADYYGYGSYLMYYSASYGWGAWAAASFSGGNFTYEYGLADYPYDAYGKYPGYYYTFLWSGAATVQ